MIQSADSPPAGQDPAAARRPAANAMALGGILGQVGCLTVAVVLLALGAGLWLDARLGTRPAFTLVLVLGSVPVTLYLMFRIVLAGARRLQGAPDASPSPPVKAGEARGEGADLEMGR